jgi:hypothetical protein
MTVGSETEVEIRRLHYAEHWKVGTIATQLGVHGDVVRRVLGYMDRGHSTIARPRKLDPFLPFVVDTLEQYPRLRATRIYDMVRARGYQGSIRTQQRAGARGASAIPARRIPAYRDALW